MTPDKSMITDFIHLAYSRNYHPEDNHTVVCAIITFAQRWGTVIHDVLYKGLVERVPYPKVKAGTLVDQPGPASLSLSLSKPPYFPKHNLPIFRLSLPWTRRQLTKHSADFKTWQIPDKEPKTFWWRRRRYLIAAWGPCWWSSLIRLTKSCDYVFLVYGYLSLVIVFLVYVN